MMHTSIERHLKNFVGSIDLLGARPAPRLRTFYSAVTSFHLSTLYARHDVDLYLFQESIKQFLNEMKGKREIYDSGVRFIDKNYPYLSVCIQTSHLGLTPEVLNIYGDPKSTAEWQHEWESISETYKDLLK